jgi:hypothetical protein
VKAATPEIKAVTSGPAWVNATPLSSLLSTPQARAAAYLRAYKVGWFYKAEHKIADDIANLDVSVAPEDSEGDNEVEIIEPDLFTPWERLDPIGQFLRLMERPNPNQTGRQLRAKTQIRLDMAGTAFWYLEGSEQGLPTAIYGISPSRMWDSRDRDGNLIGWVMDKDSPKPATFTPEEILVFATASTEDGSPWGVGVVEAVFSELPLSDMMARHTTDLLQTGGRLAGMMWPKERSLGEAEYLDAQRAWRNVASDPNAARRMLLFPEPMEWAPGASTPADIGIPELAALNRDNILTAFPISPYMLGVPLPGGLNASGEIRREEKLSYQEGTIHPRVELFEETVQVGLLSRYEAIMGTTYDFEVAEPNLDTAPALIEKVGALKALIAAGFDDKEAVAAVGLDHIKYNGPPAPVVPPAPEQELPVSAGAQPGDPAQVGPQSIVGKAVDVEDQRDVLLRQTEGNAKSKLTAFFLDQRERISDGIRSTMPKTKAARKADPGDWWDADRENAELRATLENVYVQVGRQGLQAVADNLNRIVTKSIIKPVVDDILSYGGERITAINEVTRQAVQSEIAEGVRRGYSVNQLIDGVPAENYGGIKGLTLDNGAPAFSDLRAETIARTETMLSYNRSSVTGYGAFGVERLLAYDGDGDAECAARAGNEYAIDEALSIEDHPNGTLVWSPVIEKAVEDERMHWAYDAAMKAIDALAVKPEIHVHHAISPPDVHVEMAPTTVPVTVEAAKVNVPPSIVNVTVPEMTVEPAQITVNVPEYQPPAVTVTVPDIVIPEVAGPNVQVDVHVPEPKPVTKTIKRDKSGAITRIEES